ncbi:hypothetical protein [Mycobacteroides abscessus]|uniref:hypothetical protein n=1 Tax=Mycobacteroides abscessus TaxID=36809 RepID=UPI0009A6A221|nr:hypothetical protein [Mycobacteroides abscessus]SKQ84926.1 type IV secretory pathway, VirD4 component [Mycobacteroides abscessus subsp. massiliense]
MNTDTPTICRRLTLALRRDPLARIVAPADAIRMADQLLTRTTISDPGSRLWCSIALEPLASLILAASAGGSGQGSHWVHATSATLHGADRDDAAWDEAQRACRQRRTTEPMRTALARLRCMDARQRRSVTKVMVNATNPAKRPRVLRSVR